MFFSFSNLIFFNLFFSFYPFFTEVFLLLFFPPKKNNHISAFVIKTHHHIPLLLKRGLNDMALTPYELFIIYKKRRRKK